MEKPLYVIGAGYGDDPDRPVTLELCEHPTGIDDDEDPCLFDTIPAAMSAAQARIIAEMLLQFADVADGRRARGEVIPLPIRR